MLASGSGVTFVSVADVVVGKVDADGARQTGQTLACRRSIRNLLLQNQDQIRVKQAFECKKTEYGCESCMGVDGL